MNNFFKILFFVVLALNISMLAQTTLTVTDGTAILDGVVSPGEYTSTPLLTTLGVTLNAMDDGVNFYLAATWADATESIAKKLWFFDGSTWTQSGDEDRIAFMFDMGQNDPEGVNCLSMCHPPYMNTSVGGKVDVWHWKSHRGNPMGFADDKHFNDVIGGDGGRHGDPGTSTYSDNGPDVSSLPAFMAVTDPGANVDFLVNTASLGDFDPYGVMTSSTFAEATTFGGTFSNGNVIPGYVLRTGVGDRGDVTAAGKWDTGVWTVEFKRVNSGTDNDFTVPFGGTVDFVHEIFNNEGGTIGGHEPTDLQVYTLDFSGIIPVELTSFTGQVLDGVVYLKWTTATEQNNLGFEVERRTDGDYSKIGFVSGHGTTTETQRYQYIDKVSSLQAASISYRLKQIDYDGSYEYSDEVLVGNPAPLDFALDQNYPNPFNPVTTITYAVPQNTLVSLKVFDLLGNEVETLVQENLEAGKYSVTFNAANIPSGVYFYQLEAGSFLGTKKMLLLK